MLDALIIGAGPAGLIAADFLSAAGCSIRVVDQMPSVARKFLMAGRGGLNLTHSEPLDAFVSRYREAAPFLTPLIRAFPPEALRQWCDGLGQETFVGTSGRVFPKTMKASPLLRALLQRLESQGVDFQLKTRLTGISRDNTVHLARADGTKEVMRAKTVLLALGGASWPRLGSDAAWVPLLTTLGLSVETFQPANCGFQLDWSPLLVERFAGTPLKRISLSIGEKTAMGEAVLSDKGLEGGVVYALSAEIRRTIERTGPADVLVDLRPDLSASELTRKLAKPQGKKSLSSHLKRQAGLTPAEVALLHEGSGLVSKSPEDLTARIKALPLMFKAPYPIDRAISSAGGVALTDVTEDLMVKSHPGLFLAGEMLDWEAPTGGYLLQACFAMGRRAGESMQAYCGKVPHADQTKDLEQ